MRDPSFTKRYLRAPDSQGAGELTSSNRYSVVFFSTSVARATKLAALLSVAAIRVHQASSWSEVRILLQITSAGVVLLDGKTIGPCGELLRELSADFPDVCTAVLSPFDVESAAQLYAEGAWEVVGEPARLIDLLAALESAHDLHEELTDPVRLQVRVHAVMMEFVKRRELTA